MVVYYCHACFELKSDRKRGLKTKRVVIQAEREPLLALPPVGNSDTSSARAVRANSRTQTQAALPIVSAKPLRFREYVRNTQVILSLQHQDTVLFILSIFVFQYNLT